MDSKQARAKAYGLAATGLRQLVERGGIDELLLEGEHVDESYELRMDYRQDYARLMEACEQVTKELEDWSK